MKYFLLVFFLLGGVLVWADTTYIIGGGDIMDRTAFTRKGDDTRKLGMGEVNAVAVFHGDEYAAGAYTKGEDIFACFWKNGQRTDLAAGAGSYVSGIRIFGEAVYMPGKCVEAGKTSACYWKDGARVVLTPELEYAWAWDIAVDGADIYLSGAFRIGENYHACYWKNGSLTDLGFNNSAFGITVKAGAFMIAGCVSVPDGTKPCLFTREGTLSLNLPPDAGNQAKDVVFIGDTRVVLIENTDPKNTTRNSGYLMGETWKPLRYQEVEGSLKFAAPLLGRKIAVVDGHIVIAGTSVAPTGDNSVFIVACVWIDGETTKASVIDAWKNFECVASLN